MQIAFNINEEVCLHSYFLKKLFTRCPQLYKQAGDLITNIDKLYVETMH